MERAVGVALLLALAGCSVSTAPGTAETDRIAAVVSDAISYPRQDSAEGLLRAATQTRAGTDGRLAVVGVTSLKPADPSDPMAELVYRVHLDAVDQGFGSVPAVTACYDVRFNWYGVMGEPRRTACPAGAAPLTAARIAPTAHPAIPADAGSRLARVLRALPAQVDGAALPARVSAGLGGAGSDPFTGLRNLAPEVRTAVDGQDVGVAVAGDDRACLLGSRRAGGDVLVWRPSDVQLQPGELSCTGETALARAGTSPPH